MNRIKCIGCQKPKSFHSFSANKIDELKRKMASSGDGFNPKTTAYIACSSCSGAQVVELTCFYCDMTKGLDKFAKAQRRNPDKAVSEPLNPYLLLRERCIATARLTVG